MKIKGGTYKALVKKYVGKFNEGNAGTEREIDLEIGCTRTQAKERFGEEMAEAVFAAFGSQPADGEPEDVHEGIWRLKAMKPSKRIICEAHKVTLAGDIVITCEPKVLRFAPLDESTEKVIALVRLQLGKAQAKQRRFLEDAVGCEIDVKFEAQRIELPLGDRAAQLDIIKGGVEAGA